MFDLRKIPLVKVLIPFATGAISGSLSSFSFNQTGLFLSGILAWVGLMILHLNFQKQTRWLSLLFGSWTFLLCFFSGLASGLVSRPVDPGLPVEERVIIRGLVKEAPASGPSSLKCEVLLQCLYTPDTLCQCQTLLQVYLDPEKDSLLPEAGETWQWTGFLIPIRNSGNPGSPDFESIMHRKQCWYRFYPDSNMDQFPQGRRIRASGSAFSPDHIRQALSARWKGGEEEVALLKAVCLGDRHALTSDMRQDYGNAGGMHLLAVSGLHVGLIWWVLQLATRWMVRRARSEVLRTLAVVGMLWFYASVTGFSASVCRSVTMFSFFSVGRMLGQRTQVLNGILVSALILLTIRPSWLLDPGFQLSYAAMFGIVAFYPLVRGLFKMKYRLLKWVWEAAAVSLAAQLFTAPLVIYYFHQLPLYSMVTSILAVPMLSALIALFVCSVPFMLAGLFENSFNALLMALARLMNLTMEAVSDLPGALLKDIPMNPGSLILIMVFQILVMLALQGRSRIPTYLSGLVLSAGICHGACIQATLKGSSGLVISHFRGASMVSFREGCRLDHYCWYRDSVSLAFMQNYRSEAWSPRRYENHLHEVGDSLMIRGSVTACFQLAHGIWLVGNDQRRGWVMTGKPGNKGLLRFLSESGDGGRQTPDFILLSCEPGEITPEIMAWGSFTDLVMDGSNRRWYRERMKNLRSSIHDTDRHGAYVKRW